MSHEQRARNAPDPVLPDVWWVLGPEWGTKGLRQPGWLLMPLRAFLGITFVIASLQKLANPAFFDASSPTSVQSQMRAVAPTSPIGPLVNLSLHAGWLVGLVIALTELAVGLGTLLGLKARLAACGGALLALSFFLTVSWTTTPYYYGADIVFLFAWTPFLATGAADVLSLDAFLAGPAGVSPRNTVERNTQQILERRALLGVGAAGVLLATFTAVIGRLVGGTATSAQALANPPARGQRQRTGHRQPPQTKPPPKRQHGASSAPGGMTAIGSASAVGVGQGARFTDPATGYPAWLIRPQARSYKAFSAVCTHAGCTVDYDASAQEFICPCHGGTYSAQTGAVLAGPPPAPLGAIRVDVANGTLYVR